MLRNVASVVLMGLLSIGACGPAPVTARRATGEPSVPSAPAEPLTEGGVTVVIRDAGASESMADAARETSLVDARSELVDTSEVADAGIETTDVGTETPDVPAARAPRPGQLIIDEILANPGGTDLGREWIEITNPTSDRLDLSDLHIADVATDVAVAAGTIEPRGHLVLAQSADPAKNGGVSGGIGYGTRLILNNDGEQLSICLGACATGVVLDQITWGNVGAPYDGHAMIVEPVTKQICAAGEPFGTSGDFGTPGERNPPCTAPDAGTDSGADSSLPDDNRD